jgi:MFS family permease
MKNYKINQLTYEIVQRQQRGHNSRCLSLRSRIRHRTPFLYSNPIKLSHTHPLTSSIGAPLSESFGRQILFFGTYAMLTIFNAGAAGANSMTTLLVMRFLAGAFGSSPLTNAGGVIADMFEASDRGLALSLFASAPFLGPCLGPVTGGFIGQSKGGWRWVEGYLTIFSGTLWIVAALTVPETYSPVILRRRADKMSKMTGKVYMSQAEVNQGSKSVTKELQTALSRPWILLFQEPIVLLLSIYMAIIYGTMYM